LTRQAEHYTEKDWANFFGWDDDKDENAEGTAMWLAGSIRVFYFWSCQERSCIGSIEVIAAESVTPARTRVKLGAANGLGSKCFNNQPVIQTKIPQ
jgi:hypothetical protein